MTVRAPSLRSLGARVAAVDGQAAVELVALFPVAVAVGLALFCALAAGRASEQAAHAAQAGAMALLQDADPVAAAREAASDAAQEDVAIRVAGRKVRVTVRPRLPLRGLARRLSATATADAGPAPAP